MVKGWTGRCVSAAAGGDRRRERRDKEIQRFRDPKREIERERERERERETCFPARNLDCRGVFSNRLAHLCVRRELPCATTIYPFSMRK